MALDYLERSQRRRCVLLIDDAQNLPFRVFDELRSFVDQGAAAASQICVALFGTAALEERLNLPPLYPFQQRIVSRSYLDAFESAEIADYIDCEARRVAGKFAFTTDAKRKVAELCNGAPRVANQLCDRALFLTTLENGKGVEFADNNGIDGDFEASERIATESVELRAIDVALVERAWAHLLNLPEETSCLKTGEANDVVEFGTLEDDEEENAGFNDFTAWGKSENNDFIEDGGSCAKVELENERDDPNGKVDWEIGVNSGINVVGEEFDEEFDEELSEEESDGEVDAALEARLLQNLKIGEDAKEKNDVDEEKARVDEASEPSRGDRWERADALKERRDADGWKEDAKFAEIGENSGLGRFSEESKNGENDAFGEGGAENDARTSEQKTEERVFEALKSEYFNNGFLFELNAGDEGKKEETRKGEKKTRAKSTSKTRRPIVGDDDGLRLWREANGRGDDERFLETQLTAERVANRVVADEEMESVASDWEAEFVSLEDRAYEQIVEDCWKATGNFDASDEYLSELSLLEQEIEEEANLIRRIRNIHLKLRSARAAAERKRRRNLEETNVATTDVEAAKGEEDFDDAPLNY